MLFSSLFSSFLSCTIELLLKFYVSFLKILHTAENCLSAFECSIDILRLNFLDLVKSDCFAVFSKSTTGFT